MKLDDLQKLAQISRKQSGGNQQSPMDILKEMGFDPGNFYQELEMSSRFINTHRDISYSHTWVSLHSHNYYEILYCRTCKDVEYLIGSERYRLQKGDVICIPPGVSHRPILPEKMQVPYERDVIWVSTEFADFLTGAFPDIIPRARDYWVLLRTADTHWAGVGELFRNGVVEEEQKAPGWETAVMGNTMQLIAQLRRAYSDQRNGVMKAERRELLDEITAFIEEHYAEHLTLADFAKRYYISESTISHLFKQKMGVSLYRYLTQRRLIAAKNLILQGANLENVAERIGFSDYSTFYRAFKGEFGISPRQFRSQNGMRE